MIVRVLRGLAGMAVTLLVTSFVIFGAVQAAPGDPAAFLIGGRDNVTEETIAAIREQYHLDDPFLVQYGRWLVDVLQGDLGRSFQYGDQVTDLLASRLPTTLSLVALASVLCIGAGVVLGALAAVRRGRVDSAIVAGTTLAASVPSFVTAIALAALFSVQLGWFPVAGAGEGFAGRLHHLVLPSVTLALGALAVLSRVTRQSMVEQDGLDHVEAARGAGLPERLVVRRHVFRNALAPIVTMSGLLMAGMLAGTVVVETAFGISGIGSLLVKAIETHDFPVTQAVLLLMVVAYIVVTTLIDLVHPLIDPRVRTEGRHT